MGAFCCREDRHERKREEEVAFKGTYLDAIVNTYY
jgi:hypothetical protein